MSDRVFVDTNIFVYADDRAARTKRVRARTVLSELIHTRRAVVSTQVMQEYFAAATKKLGLSPERARVRVERLNRLDVVLIRPELILGAIDLCRCMRCRSGMRSSFVRPALPDADACSARIIAGRPDD
jgi:predicted nucleic acid-binding protein